MQTTSTCPSCGGEGQTIKERCAHCHGDGIVNGEETIKINIPAGVEEGMQLSVSGKGNAAPRGGIAGDLLVIIEEIEHQKLQRDGNNLYYDLYVNFSDAAMGTTVETPTIEGKAKIRIEAGTQSGKILRLRGKWLPSVNGYGRGDLLVNINVWTPQNLSDEERKILKKLGESENFKPNPSGTDKSFIHRMRDYFN